MEKASINIYIAAISILCRMLLYTGSAHAQCNAHAGVDETICTGETVIIGGAPSGTGGTGTYTYTWSPAAGLSCTNCANPVCSATTSTSYTLTIDDGSGCTDSDDINVTVQPLPTASFTFSPNNQCSSTPVQFTNTSSGTALLYDWVFGDPSSGGSDSSSATNPQHEFIAPGSGSQSFTVTLTVGDTNGCTDQVQQILTVQQSPVVNLQDPVSSFKNCDGSNFNITVFNATSPAVNSDYHIDWGDGSTPFTSGAGTLSSASHTYTTTGVFDLVFTVTGTNGCVSEETYLANNITNPAIGVANPGGTAGCGPLNLCFPISNFGSNHPSTFYVVDYGDDSDNDTIAHAPPANICHTYTESSCADGGAYTFTIQAINACDVSISTVNPIRVFTTPQAHFSPAPQPQCVNLPVTVTNTSVLGFNSSCSQASVFTCDFGDGTAPSVVLTSAPLVHVYTAPGVYTLSLQAQNSCGTTADTQTVCIEGPPVPAFTINPDNGCVPFDVSTVNTSDTSLSCNVSYLWSVLFNGSSCLPNTSGTSFINGTNANDWEPQLDFTSSGNYTVELSLTNSCGTLTATQAVEANTIPEITPAPLAAVCDGAAVTPTATFEDCNLPITAYSWTFPGGAPATSNQEIPGSVTFAAPGSPNIGVQATNACGTASSAIPVTINAVPATPNIGGNSPVCEGLTLNLTTTSGGAGTTYSWAGPNGFVSAQQNPSIPAVTAVNAGTYSLSVTENGCTSTVATTNVVVNPAPVVSVSPTSASICEGDNTSLTASGATTYSWSPATGLSATAGATVSADPVATTTYTVTGLQSGCSADATVTVTVNTVPLVSAGPDLTLCNQPIAEQLTGSPAGGTWSGPNITPAGEFTPTGLGTFTVTYSFTDGNGCSATDDAVVDVQDPAVIVMPADEQVCMGSPVFTLNATPAGGTWSGTGVDAVGNYTPSTAGTFVLTYTFGTGTCASSDVMNVVVDPQPVVNPGVGFDVCIDAGVQNLSGTPAGGTWSGTGVTGTQFNPATAGTGAHALSYSFTDPVTGCANSAQITATVNALPVVDAGTDITVCDQPIATLLTGSPAGGTWSGTGVAPGGSFTPAGVGSFTLDYTFTDGNGCTDADQMTVTVISPTPADAGPDLEACLNDPAFLLTATPAGGSWSGTGVTVGGSFTPSALGTFTLTYAVGTGTCLTTDQMDFTVHALPVVNAGADQAFCISAPAATFTGAPAGGTWSGTGITNAVNGTFEPGTAGAGTFEIVYTFTDAVTLCLNRDTLVATVNPLPVPSFTNNPVACVGVAEQFTNTTTGGATWAWDFGDGGTSAVQDPTHTYTAVGTYTIQLIATSAAGCVDSINGTIEVLGPPVALFTLAPDSGCAPIQVSYNNLSSGVGISHSWDFGDGSSFAGANPASVTYQQGVLADTTYYITLSVTNFCGTVTHTDSVIAMPEPIAIFGPMFDVGCSPYSAEIANNSIGLPDTYFWNFGNGATSTTSDSLFTQSFVTGTEDTTYTIMLALANECGVDTAYHDITVLPNTVNAFFNTPQTSGCEPLTITFTQFSTGATFFSWDFGDGNTSLVGNPTHTFATAGTYTVQLFINDGCSFDTASVDITVFPSPPVDFTWAPDSVCVHVPFQFTNLSGPLASTSWDFGDGGTSGLNNPTHAYTTSGTFTVTLSGVSPTNGCTGSITHDIVVATNPVAAFTPSPSAGCIPLPVGFTNATTNAQFYSWNFGDGNTSIAANPNHTYAISGIYTVELIAENINGCRDTAYAAVNAFPLPNASFTVQSTDPCYQPVSSSFTNTSIGATGFSWNLGNGQTSALNSPSTTYTTPGDYTVALVATNQYGCTDTAINVVEIYQLPTALFATDSSTGCALYPLGVTNNSLFADSVFWNFGAGTSSDFDPQYTYQTPGTYSITLEVYTADGCADTLTLPSLIEIFPTPTAGFSYENISDPDPLSGTVAFTNESMGAQSYYWEFGNDESTDEHPVHRFEKFGIKSVMLVAINEFGCPDTLIQNIEVMFFKGLYVPNVLVYGHSDYQIASCIPKGLGLRTFYIAVYDTWGNLMWECSELDTDGRPMCAWDGTFQGQAVPQDAYVWRVEATFLDESLWEGQEYPNGLFRSSGTITVLR
jgi:PKD repeat protein